MYILKTFLNFERVIVQMISDVIPNFCTNKTKITVHKGMLAIDRT